VIAIRRNLQQGESLMPEAQNYHWQYIVGEPVQENPIGLSVLGTSTTVATGRVSALVVQGALSLRVLQSPSAELVSVTAGPRLGAGLVRVSGSGTEGVVGLAASEPYFDAGAYAMFELRPEPTLRLGLGFELGYAAGVVALSNTDPVATYGGPFVGALLDVSLAL
jgi:hypothetical protein